VIALLDTHTFLWAAIEPSKLSAKVRQAIANPEHELFLSTVSHWEISLKFALGKLKLTGCTPEDLVEVASQMSLSSAAFSPEQAASFYRLPRLAHKDPFDRMLVWQCLKNRWTLITRDRAMNEYEALGLITYW
jgi:PIN domain nuclease of toxin-antitoxin system